MLIRKLVTLPSLFIRTRHSIAIETSKTPNPNFIKFIPVGYNVLGDQGTLDISSPEYSDISPLAQELFKVPGITRVFYGSDYLSVAKQEKADWDALTPEIFRIVSKHFQQKIPLLTENASLQSDDIDPNDPEVVQFIKEIIANRIRPNVQEDGGDVKFLSFDEPTGILRIKMVGACAGCPSSSATLKGGIEKMLTYYVKEIKEVIAEEDCSK